MSNTITTTTKPGKPRRRKGGRRSVMTRRNSNKICRFIAAGMPLQHAAAASGIGKSTFHLWQQKHPAFAEAVEKARAKGLATRLAVITVAAKTDWHAAAWYCEHVFPDSFSKSRLELTGANGSPLAVGVGIYLPTKDSPENAKTLPVVTTAEP
jgi:hypothetical protein